MVLGDWMWEMKQRKETRIQCKNTAWVPGWMMVMLTVTGGMREASVTSEMSSSGDTLTLCQL